MKKFLPLAFLIHCYLFHVHGKAQQLMTNAQIYDFDIGDVFEHQMNWGSGAAASVDTITGKYYSINLDTVFYTSNSYSVIFAQCPPPCTSSYSSNIGYLTYYTNLADTVGTGLGTKPYNISCIDTAGYTGTFMDTTYNNQTYCGRLTTRIMSLSNGPGPTAVDSCYTYFEPYFEYWDYGLGLGQVYHDVNTCSNGFPNCHSCQYLSYYKKGSVTCGSRINVLPVGIGHLGSITELITIFPNPAKDKITIESHTPDDFEIRIYTASGLNVLNNTVKNKEEINIAGLDNGIYFVYLICKEKQEIKKLIIARQ